MRRNLRSPANSRGRALIYLSSLIALVVYAIPKLPRLQPGIAGSFSMLWILLVCVAIAANLYFLVGADVERRRMLEEQAVMEGVDRSEEIPEPRSSRSSLRG